MRVLSGDQRSALMPGKRRVSFRSPVPSGFTTATSSRFVMTTIRPDVDVVARFASDADASVAAISNVTATGAAFLTGLGPLMGQVCARFDPRFKVFVYGARTRACLATTEPTGARSDPLRAESDAEVHAYAFHTVRVPVSCLISRTHDEVV